MKFFKACWCRCECGNGRGSREKDKEVVVIKIVQACLCDKCIRIPGFIVIPKRGIHEPITFDEIFQILQTRKVGLPCGRVSLKTLDKISDCIYQAHLDHIVDLQKKISSTRLLSSNSQ